MRTRQPIQDVRDLHILKDTAGAAVRALFCVIGALLIVAFLAAGRPDMATASFCLLAFVSGGLSVAFAASGRENQIRVDARGAVVFASALACGPLGAVAASVMASLGRTFLTTELREPFRRSIMAAMIAPVPAAVAGFVFLKAGGSASSVFTALSLPAVVAASVVYGLTERLAGLETVSLMGVAISLGLGCTLGGAAWVMPAYALLIPGLPVSIALLLMLRPDRKRTALSQGSEDASSARPSLIDHLTGLANGRYLEMFLQQEIARAQRSGKTMSVLLLDLDDFARLNSVHGSEAGDRCIATVAAGVKRMIRDYDLAVRYKDDEIVVVLPESDANTSVDTAERLHSALSGQILPLRVRFSVGVATFPMHGETVDDLLSSAHHALNRAKFSGKNAVFSCHTLAKAS